MGFWVTSKLARRGSSRVMKHLSVMAEGLPGVCAGSAGMNTAARTLPEHRTRPGTRLRATGFPEIAVAAAHAIVDTGILGFRPAAIQHDGTSGVVKGTGRNQSKRTNMQTPAPSNADLESRLRGVFDSQQMLKTLNVRLLDFSVGEVRFEMPFDPRFTQQHGFMQAGLITTLIDNACGYAAYTMIPKEVSILTVEFKINFLAPAKGERFIATGKVLKPGRNLIICTGEAAAIERGESRTIAIMQATMMVMK
jgi:uncharacterized protein (TIGR00369 family)